MDGQLCDVDYAHIPPIELCVDRLADVRVENDTYVFDISERTGGTTEKDRLNLSFTCRLRVPQVRAEASGENTRESRRNRHVLESDEFVVLRVLSFIHYLQT